MNCSQLKEQGKNPEKINNERNSLPHKEFKALLMKMLSKLGKGIDLHNEKFNKELEIYLKIQIINKEFNS